MSEIKVQFRDVKKFFPHSGIVHKKYIHAVNGVSFDIREGEILAVVGESGCGKTTLARMLMKLHDITDGSIRVDGQELSEIRSRQDIKKFHSKIQMIFQDPVCVAQSRAHGQGHHLARDYAAQSASGRSGGLSARL